MTQTPKHRDGRPSDHRSRHRRSPVRARLVALTIGAAALGITGCAAGGAVTGSPSPTPSAAWSAPAVTPEVTPPPFMVEARQTPSTYNPLTKLGMARLVKDPEAYADEPYIIYGVVTQADTATGTSVVRADVSHRREPDAEFGYKINVMMTALFGQFDDAMEGDLFTARVRAAGSITYETTVGTEITCPQFIADSIEITGKVEP